MGHPLASLPSRVMEILKKLAFHRENTSYMLFSGTGVEVILLHYTKGRRKYLTLGNNQNIVQNDSYLL